MVTEPELLDHVIKRNAVGACIVGALAQEKGNIEILAILLPGRLRHAPRVHCLLDKCRDWMYNIASQRRIAGNGVLYTHGTHQRGYRQ